MGGCAQKLSPNESNTMLGVVCHKRPNGGWTKDCMGTSVRWYDSEQISKLLMKSINKYQIYWQSGGTKDWKQYKNKSKLKNRYNNSICSQFTQTWVVYKWRNEHCWLLRYILWPLFELLLLQNATMDWWAGNWPYLKAKLLSLYPNTSASTPSKLMDVFHWSN